ncbi:carbohydrate oxidase from Microdochium Nivale in complex with substrate analogue [Lasiosphaeria miniovina]|uniref:Carbohydrate oxidase from Microdochium Nivale in complex with substrate analogue n=1 Tax=Lasiosphaeria miniovina TaxID=1954250 RepID=A0AA40DHM5_9PEZI|nr:carbohydrate oxidase from Microdochium Nivale in complex with substrate analogue [Lasiosphaeria miniovina]KAK0703894.1 carbohydrate oxidase from Microdochium Nivale in complex with substrate analogue [Lasiosphaeria miniovina]
MRTALALTAGLGLAVPLVQGRAVVTRADIEDCLTSAGVPIDVKGSADWQRDAAPFNLRVPFTPVAISVPTTVKHIQKSVLCGKKLGVKVTAKSGGHSYASLGFGGEDGHLVVELDRMTNVTVDAENIATVQPGTRLGHLATELYTKYGRAVAHGTCPGVGISGHFLHGGFGFSSHKHGLAVDQVVGATVVLADGSVVEASEKENADLFWGLRGAGSNFGIVASWRLRTFEAPKTLTWFGVSLGWNSSTAVAGLEALECYARNVMPAELNFRVSDYERGKPGIEGLFYGTDAEMRAAIAPLLASAAPLANVTDSHTVDWLGAAVHYSFYDTIDWLTPSPQETFYSKSLTLKGLSGKSAQNFVDYWFNNATQVTERNWWFQLDMHGGANSAVTQLTSSSATSYAHRDKLYIIQFYDRVSEGVYPTGGQSFLDGWVDAVTKPLKADSWGMYINYADTQLDRATAQRVYYGDNLPRLQQLKAKYDPSELFYYPQSVQPAKKRHH